MKALVLIASFISLSTFAGSISGVVEAKGSVPSGVLYIFAKKYNSPMPMPLAVKRIENPKFPIKFSLSEKDKMMEHMPFKGPFTVIARISPSGSAMDRSGKEAQTTEAINLGDKSVNLILK